ncbi:hypothetical protein CWB99_00750 [Pseudoalteromonas rubra]|uniref:Uncharacterized protein n=1 Tax=Pseudoalteromonas rubra TaxID=43658 RepID=A0A5S3WV03_9GAMM|nr:hypothetical protein [Pseudoalteromonas rubra]TMP31706.1 hypothetical protein CWC00_13885 [Pseudoalteromonas rubra]TMP33212.1 hypothetical protein CWB99_00750 [Pseudoalteromonas rubra]
MDAFKPFLAPIVRLQVSHDGPFKVAGVLDNRTERIKRKKHLLEMAQQKHKEEDARKKDEDGCEIDDEEQHLDTWA